MNNDQAQNNAASSEAVSTNSGEKQASPTPKVHVKNIAENADSKHDFVLLYEAGKTRELDTPQTVDADSLNALNSMSDVLAAQLRRQHSDHASKQFDFAPLIGSLEKYADSDHVAVMLNLSKSGAGRMFALQSDKVAVGYDGARGVIHVTGEKADVTAFLGEVYFFGNMKALQHFYIDVHVLPADMGGDFSFVTSAQASDIEPLASARLIMLYEPSSGFYVAYQGNGSRGAVPVESDLVNITTPSGEFAQFSPRVLDGSGHAMQQIFNVAQQANQTSAVPVNNFDLDPDNLLASIGVSNAAPIAVNDAYATVLNTAFAFDDTNGLTGLLDNDSDPEGVALTISAIDAASLNGGSIVDNGNGTFTYTPPVFFVGTDSFSYSVSDGLLTTSATVTFTIPQNLVLTASIADILLAVAANAAFTGAATDWHVGDSVMGGAGADSLTLGTGGVTADLDANYTNISGVESFNLNANAAHNFIFGDGYFNRATGVEGDVLSVQTSSNVGVTINGSATLDATHRLSITTASGNDTVSGGAGNDTISVGAGTDSVNAGAGDDVITVEANLAPVVPALVTGNLVLQLDASNAGSLTLAGSTVTGWNDQSVANNDGLSDTGAPQTGGNINGLNAITFDGNDWLQVANTNDINLLAQPARSVFIAFETGADVATRQVIYEQGGQTNGFAIYIAGGNLYTAAWRNNNADFGFYQSTPIAANTNYVAGFVFDHVLNNNFTGYLDGLVIASAPLVLDQSAHSGGIGIGGVNFDSRHESGAFAGDGLGFDGEIGEVLNYNDALTAPEITQVTNYLSTKWSGAPIDQVQGGAGTDILHIAANTFDSSLTSTGDILGIEQFNLTASDASHNIVIEDNYYTTIDGTNVSVTAAGIATAISLSAFNVSAANSASFIGGAGNDTLTGGAGNDIINGASGADTIDGRGGNDSLTGGDGNNTINGGAGNDTLVGGASNDTLDGGSGIDFVDYSSSAIAVSVDLDAGTATGQGNDVLQNIDQILGSAFNDTIVGSNASETLTGGAGNDQITGGDSFPSGAFTVGNLVARLDAANTASITTSPGNVTLWNDQSTRNNDGSNDSGNVVSGGSTINGLNSLQFDGASHLGIADSNDINTNSHTQYSVFVTFETSADVNTRQVVYEQGGNVNGFNIYIENGDLYVGAWTDTGATLRLFLNTSINANETYSAGFVFDHATTQTFTGYLNGVAFDSSPTTANHSAHSGDIGIGGLNNASFFDSTGADGGDNINHFTGEIGELLIYNDALTAPEATSTSNYLLGKWHSGDADSIDGGAGNDTLIGGGVNDTINGGANDDQINGRLGADVLSGGTGNDMFIYDDIRDSGTGAANRDVITDFTSGMDRIDLSTIGGFVAASANGAGGGVGDFTNTAGQAVWGQSGADIIIFLDQDGDSVADAEIQLTGISTLQASDFVF